MSSRLTLFGLAAVLVVAIGLTDYSARNEISLSIFYVIPISVTAWAVGRFAGLSIAFASALAWLIADLHGTTHSHGAIPYWNACVRLSFFVIIALVLDSRRRSQERNLRLMHAKSEFTATVSHELRTPLTCIEEGIGLVLDGTAGSLNQSQVKALETAKRNVDRLARLVNDVLSYQQLVSRTRSSLTHQAPSPNLLLYAGRRRPRWHGDSRQRVLY